MMKYTRAYGTAGTVPNKNNHAPSNSSVLKCLFQYSRALLGGSSKALKQFIMNEKIKNE